MNTWSIISDLAVSVFVPKAGADCNKALLERALQGGNPRLNEYNICQGKWFTILKTAFNSAQIREIDTGYMS